MRILIALACVAGLACSGLIASARQHAHANAQPHDELAPPEAFTFVADAPAHVQALSEFVRPDIAQGRGALARINWHALQAILDAAPLEAAQPALDAQPILPLAMPDGSHQHFRVLESPVMEPGLAAQLPNVRTYKLLGIDDPTGVGRIDVSQFGFRALLRTSDGPMFIDPYSAQDREFVSVYYLRDLDPRAESWFCSVGPEHGAGQPQPEADQDYTFEQRAPVTIRQYRLAMACTGEFGTFHSELLGNQPNAADAMAAIVTVANRCNLTFEVDLGVRFQLVANNMLLAFFDPATDPYPAPDPICITDPAANCSGPYLDVNQGIVNSIIGTNNYDVGHLLTRVRGGVAFLSSVCGSNKAAGISGIPRGGELDPLSALVPMHELGHQFGANHTFNGVQGRCQGNINSSTSWEPGGGSTIMAYPGACPVGGGISGDNLVVYADPYFNAGSVAEMRTFLNSGSSNCSSNIPTGNEQPTLLTISPTNSAVPPQTPFRLSASVLDDSPTLAYSWEQFDASQPRPLGSPDPGAGPLFRSFPPTGVASRSFPAFESVLSGVLIRGEQFPTVANRNRTFRFMARDNQGGTLNTVISVLIRSTPQPFVFTVPVQDQRFRAVPVNIAWNVAGTNQQPFNVSTLRLSLSQDNGTTWSLISAGVPNTGTFQFVPPAGTNTAQARVMLEANAGIFYIVSSPFEIRPACDPIDFNNDGGSFDPTDIDAFLSVYSEGPCVPQTAACNDIDFNNDANSFDPCDISSFLLQFSEGPCTLCGQ